MKSEPQITKYLAAAGGDLPKAINMMIDDHHFGDQTIMMKTAILEKAHRAAQMAKEGKDP